jgi:hypothetical protein
MVSSLSMSGRGGRRAHGLREMHGLQNIELKVVQETKTHILW